MKTPAPRASLVDDVTARLSSEITVGKYKDRELLPTEKDLIARFGVSRTVVREATKQLVSRGLVEVEHGRGVRIVNHLHVPLNRSLELRLPNSRERLEKLLEVRRLTEPAVARLAALRATAADIRGLHEVQERLQAAQDADAAVAADAEFHRLLTRAAGNAIFELMLESLTDLGRESRLATISEVGWLRAHQHHAEILSAVERSKPDEAEAAMAKHLEVAGVDLRRHFKDPR